MRKMDKCNDVCVVVRGGTGDTKEVKAGEKAVADWRTWYCQ